MLCNGCLDTLFSFAVVAHLISTLDCIIWDNVLLCKHIFFCPGGIVFKMQLGHFYFCLQETRCFWFGSGGFC